MEADKTFVWTYDNAGNITGRQEYPYISHTAEVTGTPTAAYTYTYGDSSWGDLLTAYNGVSITYDRIGNPLNDGTWTYTWQNGRELASMTNGTTTWNYTYDADGMRTSRSNGTKTYNYVYNGSQLTQMTVGSDTLYFTYGLLGPTTVTWNGVTYYYALNGQGDVTGIFDPDGILVVTYNWNNAWGCNPEPEGTMASTLGILNPLRYRSYVYDEETELYYLQSRYYDPEIGRFINADDVSYLGIDGSLLSYNLFTYCKNNFVMGYDPNGHFGLVGAIIATGAIVGGLLGAFSAATTGGNILESAIEGCLTGALGAACGILIPNPFIAVGLATIGSAAIDFTTQVTTQYIKTKSVDVAKIDYGRVAKTGLQTGIGTAVPAFGEGAGNAVDACGTALIWAEASAMIACADVAITNTITTVKSSPRRVSRNRYGAVLYERRMLVT